MDWARASLWGGKALGLALALLWLTRSIEPDGPAAWGIAAGGVLLILCRGGLPRRGRPPAPPWLPRRLPPPGPAAGGLAAGGARLTLWGGGRGGK